MIILNIKSEGVKLKCFVNPINYFYILKGSRCISCDWGVFSYRGRFFL